MEIGLLSPKMPALPAPSKDIPKAAQAFESMFISEMTGHMFSGLSTEAPFGGGHAEETYRSLLISAMSDQIAAKQGLGISDAIQKVFLSQQEQGD